MLLIAQPDQRAVTKPTSTPTGYPVSLVLTQNGRLCTFCNNEGFFYSDDGGTVWIAAGGGTNDYRLAHNGGVVVAAGLNFVLVSNNNGENYANVTPAGYTGGITNHTRAFFYDGLFLIITQQKIWYSSDGATWVKIDFTTLYAGLGIGNPSAIAFYDGNWFVGCSNGAVPVLYGRSLSTLAPLADYPSYVGLVGTLGECNGMAIAGNKLYLLTDTTTVIEVTGTNVSGICKAPYSTLINTFKTVISDGKYIYYPNSNYILSNLRAS